MPIPEQVLLLSPISLNGAMGLALKLTVADPVLVIVRSCVLSPWRKTRLEGEAEML